MRMNRLVLAGVIAFALSSQAVAQPAPADPAPLPDVPPPPPPAEGAPAPAPAEPACVPACRAGFTCLAGVCISACNPPCAAGEQCTSGGECVAASAPPPAFPAEEPPIGPPPDEGVQAHDGFMLRLTFGLGSGNLTQSFDDEGILGTEEIELSGLSGTFSLDIGGAPIENLVIHGRLASMAIVGPTVTLDGQEVGEADEDATVGAYLFAPAVTYYFMPVNVYVTGAIGFSWFVIRNQDADASSSSDGGVGLNIDAGKEWWVGDQWGLGVAGRFWYSHVTEEDGGLSTDLDFIGWGILFSVTFQ